MCVLYIHIYLYIFIYEKFFIGMIFLLPQRAAHKKTSLSDDILRIYYEYRSASRHEIGTESFLV